MSEMTNKIDREDTCSRKDDTLIARSEESDVSIRGLAKFGVALVALGIVANLLVWGMFNYFNKTAEKSQAPPPPMFKGNQLPPEPRLQGAPGHQSTALEDLFEMRQREEKILGSYGWVDQESGIVHIPIGEAKKLTLQKGTDKLFAEEAPKPRQQGQ
jgi:hypothetical protein